MLEGSRKSMMMIGANETFALREIMPSAFLQLHAKSRHGKLGKRIPNDRYHRTLIVERSALVYPRNPHSPNPPPHNHV
jgi:hypothetical protein